MSSVLLSSALGLAGVECLLSPEVLLQVRRVQPALATTVIGGGHDVRPVGQGEGASAGGASMSTAVADARRRRAARGSVRGDRGACHLCRCRGSAFVGRLRSVGEGAAAPREWCRGRRRALRAVQALNRNGDILA